MFSAFHLWKSLEILKNLSNSGTLPVIKLSLMCNLFWTANRGNQEGQLFQILANHQSVSSQFSARLCNSSASEYKYWWSLELRWLYSLFDGAVLIREFFKKEEDLWQLTCESTKAVLPVLESKVPFSSGKTNLPSPPSIDNPTSLVGVWRPNVMDNSVVLIRVTLSSATFIANTASAIMLMILKDSITSVLP